MLQEQKPLFFPSAAIPPRFFGLASGYTSHEIDDDFLDLLYNDLQFRPLVDAVAHLPAVRRVRLDDHDHRASR